MRKWRKQWSYDWLFGSMRHILSLEQQAVWHMLLDMAAISRVDGGIIAASLDKPYSYEWIAGFLEIPIALLESTVKICVTEKSMSENHNGLKIVNWNKYQSEYDRQKPYREARKQSSYGENWMDLNPDEITDETIVHGQSVGKIKQVLAGKIPALEANKKIYRHIFRKLGIPIPKAKK